jgi:hypothetical protein
MRNTRGCAPELCSNPDFVFASRNDQLSSCALSFDDSGKPPPHRIVRELRGKLHIVNVIEVLPSHYPSEGGGDIGVYAFRPRLHPMPRQWPKALAIVSQQGAVVGTAEDVRLFQNRVERRREIAGRGIDDLQYLGGRGLLLKRFSKFSLTLGKPTSQIGDELLGIG